MGPASSTGRRQRPQALPSMADGDIKKPGRPRQAGRTTRSRRRHFGPRIRPCAVYEWGQWPPRKRKRPTPEQSSSPRFSGCSNPHRLGFDSACLSPGDSGAVSGPCFFQPDCRSFLFHGGTPRGNVRQRRQGSLAAAPSRDSLDPMQRSLHCSEAPPPQTTTSAAYFIHELLHVPFRKDAGLADELYDV